MHTLSSPAVLVWAAALVVFLIAEGATAGLVSIWLAAGALVALIIAAVGGGIVLQAIAFLLVSALTLVLTRPLAKRYINNRHQPTNADRCIGRAALVSEEISELNGTGAVRLDGLEWSARTKSGAVIPAGATVTVREIQGVRLIVEPAEKTAES